MRRNDFLFEIKPEHFIILPGTEKSQEEAMAVVPTGRGKLYVKRFPQKDGSRFAVIKNSRGAMEVLGNLQVAQKEEREIWIESKIDRLSLLQGFDFGTITTDKFSYLAYRLHRFTNGCRYALLLVNERHKTFYNLTTFLPNNVPEDDFGLFFEDKPKSLLLGGGLAWSPTVIDCLARIRLCACCGEVSDFGKVKHGPWLNWKNPGQNIKRIKQDLDGRASLPGSAYRRRPSMEDRLFLE